jgi:uncharacterized membrane protein YbaN (DUF454 family)
MQWLRVLTEPLALWKFWIDMSSAGFGVLAAACWLRASLVRTPRLIRDLMNQPIGGPLGGDTAELTTGIRRQSKWNAWAAALAAAAALLTAVSVLIGTRWD